MTGVVQGGWEFVIAAYSVTAIGFLVYAVSLFTRLKGANKHD
jgi:hypothetical protein